MLQDRDDVGEAFMEGEHVGVGRHRVVLAQPVQDGMRGLVRDDVVRQRGEHDLSGQVGSGVVVRRGEVPEQQGEKVLVEVRVLADERMGIDPQPPLAPPSERPPERPLEGLQHPHDHGVDHLLVEPGVGLGDVQAVVEHHGGVVKVDRLVPALVHRVVVDDLHQPPGGAGLDLLVTTSATTERPARSTIGSNGMIRNGRRQERRSMSAAGAVQSPRPGSEGRWPGRQRHRQALLLRGQTVGGRSAGRRGALPPRCIGCRRRSRIPTSRRALACRRRPGRA